MIRFSFAYEYICNPPLGKRAAYFYLKMQIEWNLRLSYLAQPPLWSQHNISPVGIIAMHNKQINIWQAGLLSRPRHHRGSRESGHKDLCAVSVSRNQSPRWGKQLGPAHLRTPLQLVLAQPFLFFVFFVFSPLSACDLCTPPGQNRWINTETRTNYKGSVPLPL